MDKDVLKKECMNVRSDKKIAFEEGGIKFILKNPDGDKIKEILYDDCIRNKIKEKRVACDAVYITEKNVLYVELKGSDVNHAMRQIKESVKDFSGWEMHKSPSFAYIICKRVPSQISSRVQKIKKFLKERYDTTMYIRSRLCEICIKDLQKN